jgi:pyruvate,water dikinase
MKLEQLLGTTEGTALATALASGLEQDITTSTCLERVAAGELSWESFLEQFGHRAAGEMELMEPRWREDAEFLRRMVAQGTAALRATPAGGHRSTFQHGRARYEAAKERLPAILAEAGGSCFQREIEGLVENARTLLPYREIGRHYLMIGYELIRLALLELGRRWNLGDDIFFLHWNELAGFELHAAQLRSAVPQRRFQWRATQAIRPREVLDSAALDGLSAAPPIPKDGHFRGETISPGVAEGPVRIVTDPRTAGAVTGEFILVCPSTDPGWTPLFASARGLIVEQGGVLSHGAIVAREFGIPAVVCPGATSQLREGERVRVNGDMGSIEKL